MSGLHGGLKLRTDGALTVLDLRELADEQFWSSLGHQIPLIRQDADPSIDRSALEYRRALHQRNSLHPIRPLVRAKGLLHAELPAPLA